MTNDNDYTIVVEESSSGDDVETIIKKLSEFNQEVGNITNGSNINAIQTKGQC